MAKDMDNVGVKTILPSTFKGGPRYLQANYQDCMAIVRKCGAPSFFITFTSNPRWKEISDGLQYGQTAADRPDLVPEVPLLTSSPHKVSWDGTGTTPAMSQKEVEGG
jgi:hypothetical protein